MSTLLDRQIGLLYGLASGDKNLGPLNMGIIIAESLLSCRSLRLADVFFRLLKWYKTRGEGCLDTGRVGHRIFRITLDRFAALGDEAQQEKWILDQSERINAEMRDQTAGVNPAHRGSVLSMLSLGSLNFVENLPQSAISLARLTHWNILAGQCSGLVNLLCRSFALSGIDGFQSIPGVSDPLTRLRELCQQALDDAGIEEAPLVEACFYWAEDHEISTLHEGGFSPLTLRNSLCFVRDFVVKVAHRARDVAPSQVFAEVMGDCFRFSGASNYTPVLVGTLLGSLVGKSEIPTALLSHHSAGTMKRLENIEEQMRVIETE